MKVAFVHSFYNEQFPSGENSAVISQVRALERVGHEVKLFAIHTSDEKPTVIYKLRAALRVASGLGKNPLREIKAFGPDIVHVTNLFPNYSTRWLRKLRSPFVVSLHNYRPICAAGTFFVENQQCFQCLDKSNSLPSVRKRCYRNSFFATLPLSISNRNLSVKNPIATHAAKILVLTEEAKQYYQKAGWPSEKLEIVPNFIDTYDQEILKSAMTVNKNPDWIVVGRLTPEKGILQLIADWPANERLVIVGDGPLKSKITELIQPRANISAVGSQSRENVLQLMAKSTGLVFPSLWPEGLPLVFLEAISLGLPTVAREGNVVSGFVRKFEIGGTYSSAGELSEALARARMELPGISSRSIKAFNADFTEESWLSRVTKIYASEVR